MCTTAAERLARPSFVETRAGSYTPTIELLEDLRRVESNPGDLKPTGRRTHQMPPRLSDAAWREEGPDKMRGGARKRDVLKLCEVEDLEDVGLEDLRWVESNPGDL